LKIKVTGIDQEKIDRILLGDCSLKELQPFFPDREAALKYHAQRMTELFLPDRRIGDCECCGRRHSELRVSFSWRGIYHTARTVLGTVVGLVFLVGGHAFLPHRQINFTTTHGLCNDCFARMRRDNVFGQLLEKLCFTLIILSAIVLVLAVVMTTVLFLPRPTLREIMVVSIGDSIGLGGLIGGIFGARKAVRWYIPKSLRFISKPPFELIGFKKYK
jgi:hypothetical protein